MKYLLGLAALSIGALAQDTLGPIDQTKIQVEILPIETNDRQQELEVTEFKDPLNEQPEISVDWAMVDDGNYAHGNNPRPYSHDDRR